MTKKIVGVMGLFVAAIGIVGCGQSPPTMSIPNAGAGVVEAAESKPAVQDRSVVSVEGAEEFRVEQTEWVRLTGSAIAGGEVSAEVKGPARLVRINRIRQVIDGKTPVGSAISEFELQPTGKGKVEVTLTKTSPIPNTDPEKEKVSFTVE